MTHTPKGLQERGQRLWRDTLSSSTPSAAGLVLLEEACRIADRLDALDNLITSGGESTLLGDALQEARLQAAALKALVAELRQSAIGTAMPSVQTGARVRDELAARRRDRLSNASGS